MKSCNFIAQVLFIGFSLLATVSCTPKLLKASDGREYIIETELKYNWYEAWHECARRDFQLVVIDSADKNNAIIELLKKVVGKSHNLWLGGNDNFSPTADTKRPFYWSATGQQFKFSFWSQNNPDNYLSREHCVHIWASKPLFEWNDNDCNNKIGFICELNHHLERNKCKANQTVIENIDRIGEDWKIEMQRQQNATQAAIEKILEEQEKSVKQMMDDILKEVSDLDEKLKKSSGDINTKFSEKLKGKQNEINKVC